MTTQERIQSRILLVEDTFKDVAGSPLEESYQELVTRLDSFDQEFISLAYEAASFKIAGHYIKSEPNKWVDFLDNYSQIHSVQVHIGLGWAIGKVRLPFNEVLDFVKRDNLRYVADGLGFFYGTLRRRKVIEEQARISNLEGYELYFDEGLGRSLWYSSGGDLMAVKDIIDKFDEVRQRFLWRGIGIAFTYAGGFDSDTTKVLKQVCGKHVNDVCNGVASVIRSRSKAGTVNDYAIAASREICGCEIEALERLFP